jgi:hypothetical protein
MVELFKNKANARLKNDEKWSCMEISTSNNDLEGVILLYEYLLKKREAKIQNNKEKACKFLKTIPDFYLEMNWEVNIPLLSFLCPSDTCQIKKHGADVRMDYTFIGFKALKSIRSPSCYYFNGNSEEKKIHIYDLKKKVYHNPYEPLEEDEKELIIKDILNSHRIYGEFKLKECDINPCLSSWSKKPVYEKIKGYNAQKYEVNITALTNLRNKAKFEYKNLNDYFDGDKELEKEIIELMNAEETKKHLTANLNVKNEHVKSTLLGLGNNKDKKLKAYVWIAEGFPLKASVKFY